MNNPSFAFIGAGNMATSLIGGLIANGCKPDRIRVSDPESGQLDRLHRSFPVQTLQNNSDVVANSDAVVIAVKPHDLKQVAEEIAGAVRQHHPLVITIAAGIREPDLRRWLGGDVAIVRAMPNTPALVQSAATALYPNKAVDSNQRDLAESVMRAVGLVVWVDDESLMDAVTALSGSGPAYFLHFMEFLQEAGEDLGLPAETARLLALQTAFGAAKMALESSEDPEELRKRVTSPGGTTEQAIGVFEQGKLRELVFNALHAAHDRSEDLATQLGESK